MYIDFVQNPRYMDTAIVYNPQFSYIEHLRLWNDQ